AVSGPPMPLAVLRKQVRDLPFDFSLDDSMAMQPQLKLSGFDQVMLGARVSRNGTVTQQPGEPRGDLGPIPTQGSSDIQLLIDSVATDAR
ncbi:MAG: c-type cytochrome biogenesis protein CcmI, partial [Gammaproteobacteria bacterium]|nr:c-type cytochrome biogenesis protein CcmI [Gammaproteobacteria bacterium]